MIERGRISLERQFTLPFEEEQKPCAVALLLVTPRKVVPSIEDSLSHAAMQMRSRGIKRDTAIAVLELLLNKQGQLFIGNRSQGELPP